MGLENLINGFRRICTRIWQIFGRARKTGTHHPNENSSDVENPEPGSEGSVKDVATGSQISKEVAHPEPEPEGLGEGEFDEKGTDTEKTGKIQNPPASKDKKLKTPSNRRGARGKKKQSPTKPKLPPESQPELVCREIPGHNQYEIVLVSPPGKNADVSQDGTSLSAINGNEYALRNFSDDINWKENDIDKKIKLFDGSGPLVFKLRKNWKGEGRQVKRMSNGYHVAFAPSNWQRNGRAPVEESNCVDDQFLAHYFFANGNDEPSGFVGCNSFYEKERFSLKGQSVYDDSDLGALFVDQALELIDANENSWHNVSWVRVGEEGGGQWGRNYKPTEKTLADVLEYRDGWFYVRIYDENVELIESLDFRRLTGLKKILINGKPHSSENIIVPDNTGQAETTIQFIGNNISIENKENDESENPHVIVQDSKTAMIAPHPEADRTCWTLNKNANLVIHLPRVWWRLNSVSDENSEWRDTALEMSRDEFLDNRNARVVVRLPMISRKICVGFDSFSQHEGAREYSATQDVENAIKHAEFKLNDFCDHREISEHSHKETILHIQCDKEQFSLIRIPADAPPNGEQHPPERISRPVTSNKGFSLGELDAAGLTAPEAKQAGLRVDRRRRSKYCVNIAALQNKEQEESHAD